MVSEVWVKLDRLIAESRASELMGPKLSCFNAAPGVKAPLYELKVSLFKGHRSYEQI
jgi:hypothetical protein